VTLKFVGSTRILLENFQRAFRDEGVVSNAPGTATATFDNPISNVNVEDEEDFVFTEEGGALDSLAHEISSCVEYLCPRNMSASDSAVVPSGDFDMGRLDWM